MASAVFDGNMKSYMMYFNCALEFEWEQYSFVFIVRILLSLIETFLRQFQHYLVETCYPCCMSVNKEIFVPFHIMRIKVPQFLINWAFLTIRTPVSKSFIDVWSENCKLLEWIDYAFMAIKTTPTLLSTLFFFLQIILCGERHFWWNSALWLV